MKRTLFLSVLFGMLLVTAHAENESHQQVDSTLYAYYRWCNNNIRDTAVLSKADTLFRALGREARHPDAGRCAERESRPLLFQQRPRFAQGMDSPRAGFRPQAQPAQILLLHMVAADPLLYQAGAIHARPIRAGAVYVAGRKGQLQARNRRCIQTTRAHLPHTGAERGIGGILPQGNRLHDPERARQIPALEPLFGTRDHADGSATLSRSRRGDRKGEGLHPPA